MRFAASCGLLDPSHAKRPAQEGHRQNTPSRLAPLLSGEWTRLLRSLTEMIRRDAMPAPKLTILLFVRSAIGDRSTTRQLHARCRMETADALPEMPQQGYVVVVLDFPLLPLQQVQTSLVSELPIVTEECGCGSANAGYS